MSDFLTRNKPDWQELEALVARARKKIGRMTPAELARLDVLYRRTTVHLAQVATRTQDVQLIEYLNHLTAAAHSVIYLPPAKSMAAVLRRRRALCCRGLRPVGRAHVALSRRFGGIAAGRRRGGVLRRLE